MNSLEQYIVEVHSEEPYKADWTQKFTDSSFVKVEATINCYGSKRRVERVFTAVNWERYQEQGYWME